MNDIRTPWVCSQCGTSYQSEARYCATCGKSRDILSSSNEATLVDTTGRLSLKHLLHERYLIAEMLGKGGMGAVYKAYDQQFGGRIIAIKEMSQAGLTSEQIPIAVEQFKKEAHLLANLTHPHLPRIYDYFQEQQRWYLVMDYIEGETLEKYAERSPTQSFPVQEALEIGIQLASVLDYLHSRSTPIIFRDLKPLNVMITPQRHVYLIDFGIARHFIPGKEQDTIPYLTPGYAAPEQFGLGQTSPLSDVYSLGVLLHRLLSGQLPQNNTTLFQFQPLQTYRPSIPPQLSRLVEQMTNFHPESRPTSMDLVKQMLERIASENAFQALETRSSQNTTLPNVSGVPPIGSYSGVPSLPVNQLVQPRRKRSFIGLLIAVIVLILLLNVGLGAWFLGKNASQTTGSTPLTQTLSHSHPTSIVVPTSTPTQIVNIAPTAPLPTPTPTAIAYPSDAQAKDEISYYYTHGSDFSGKNVIKHFDTLTYGPFVGPASQPQFIACAQYQYALVSSPTVTVDTVRHTFTFQYTDGGWSVIDIGNLKSC